MSVDLARLEALCEAATPGPWEAWDHGLGWHYPYGVLDHRVENAGVPIEGPPPERGGEGHGVLVDGVNATIFRSRSDDRFVAAARDAVPELVAEVERLRGWLERIRRYECYLPKDYATDALAGLAP